MTDRVNPTGPRLTRRRATALLAGVGATAMLGSVRAAQRRADVVIVGGGTAGLMAALFAAERGLDVVVLEKAGQLGGTLWFSGGQMSAAGTRIQRERGIEDNANLHFEDVMRISRGTADPTLVRLATTHAAPMVDWLEANGLEFGAEFPAMATGHEPYSAPRLLGMERRGIAILDVLNGALERSPRRPNILMQAAVEELILDRRGNARGVVARLEDGTRRDFRAPHVLLTSGGYAANGALFADVNGVPMYRQAGWPMNDGIGVTLARSAGGYTRGRENYLCDFGSIPADITFPSPELARSNHHPQKRQPWEIAVNARGERFMREDAESVDERERHLVEQPDHRYWLVFDQRILDSSPALIHSAPPDLHTWERDELLAAFDVHPAFVRGDSLRSLGSQAGIDPDGIERTVAAYNAGQRSGTDRYGRAHCPLPIERGPFYAIRHQGATLIAMAGVAVDDKLRVRRTDGSPVNGLHAAGELLGNANLSGKAFCGGMSVTPALSFGRLLGRTIGA